MEHSNLVTWILLKLVLLVSCLWCYSSPIYFSVNVTSRFGITLPGIVFTTISACRIFLWLVKFGHSILLIHINTIGLGENICVMLYLLNLRSNPILVHFVQIQRVPSKNDDPTPMFLGCKPMLECLNLDSHSTKNGDHIQEMVLGCSWFEYHNSRSFLVEKKSEIPPSLLIKSTM